jgi:hypothetical protein
VNGLQKREAKRRDKKGEKDGKHIRKRGDLNRDSRIVSTRTPKNSSSPKLGVWGLGE